MAVNSGWKLEILNQKAEVDEQGIIRCKPSDLSGVKYHEFKPKGAALRELAKDPLHQINWETPYYFGLLDEFMKGVDPKTAVVVDLGCGDGRFCKYLLDHGFQKIICSDAHLAPLLSLAAWVKEQKAEDKVMVVHAGAEDDILKPNSVDVTLSFGVFYYLGAKYKTALQSIHKSLKKNGLLISSDPDLEGLCLRALVFGSFSEMLRIFSEKTFKEEREEDEFRFSIHEKKDLIQIYENEGYSLKDERNLTLFHQFVRILLVRGQITKEEVTEKSAELRRFFDFIEKEGTAKKTLIFKFMKESK